MKNYLAFILIFCFILLGCYNNPKIDVFSFDTGHALADKQDQLIHQYKNNDTILVQEADELEKNLWVKTACDIAPSNLVIRQYCLIDLIRDAPLHYQEILQQVRSLSYNGQIWAEGYSYWEYTYRVLDVWVNNFGEHGFFFDLIDLIENINRGFVLTSYKKGDLFYPAPFGDLRNEPLSDDLQKKCIQYGEPTSVTHSIITLNRDSNVVHYSIKGKPVGLNTHVPKYTFYVEIKNGESNFPFYTGYDNKYKNKKEEMLDTFDTRRVKSLKDL